MTKVLTLQSATDLLHQHMQNANLRKHCYAVGFALADYFDFYKKERWDAGGLNKEQWQIVGLLHDSDWEETKDDETQHTLKLLEWLKDYNAPEEMPNVFKSHNSKNTKLREPQTLLEWTLECCDELTGFIVACALVLPSKKLADVTVERIQKKFNQKEFARAVDRNQILQCEEKLKINHETFIKITLQAMQNHSDELQL